MQSISFGALPHDPLTPVTLDVVQVPPLPSKSIVINETVLPAESTPGTTVVTVVVCAEVRLIMRQVSDAGPALGAVTLPAGNVTEIDAEPVKLKLSPLPIFAKTTCCPGFPEYVEERRTKHRAPLVGCVPVVVFENPALAKTTPIVAQV